MKKSKLKDFIRTATDFWKTFLLFYSMTVGFYFTYGVLWLCIGWPLTGWAHLILVGLAGLTEYGYYRWAR